MVKKKFCYFLYIALFLIFCLIPLAIMPFYTTDGSVEKRTLAPLPTLREKDGSFNMRLLSDWGDYFTDHYAFRQELVTANSALDSSVFSTSGQDSVILGQDSWLYYKDCMPDYIGGKANCLSVREQHMIIHNLSLIRDYVASKGASFYFTIAPNKPSIYPQYIPPNQKRVDGNSTSKQLTTLLSESDISYVDLFAELSDKSGLYYRGDLHWNDRGASIGHDALMQTMDRPYTAFANKTFTPVNDYRGDLYQMLYPKGAATEDRYICDYVFTYTYDKPIDSTYDTDIHTSNPKASDNLLMYRDSFTNTLLPYMAEDFRYAYFTRNLPYNFTLINTQHANRVVVELVERNLSYLLTYPSVIAAANRTDLILDPVQASHYDGNMTVTKAFDLFRIYGKIDNNTITDDDVFLLRLTGPSGSYLFDTLSLKDATIKGDTIEGYGYEVHIDPTDLSPGDYDICLVYKQDGVYQSSPTMGQVTVE